MAVQSASGVGQVCCPSPVVTRSARFHGINAVSGFSATSPDAERKSPQSSTRMRPFCASFPLVFSWGEKDAFSRFSSPGGKRTPCACPEARAAAWLATGRNVRECSVPRPSQILQLLYCGFLDSNVQCPSLAKLQTERNDRSWKIEANDSLLVGRPLIGKPREFLG